ncbi:MAG: histidinol dehydrogenase [Actinobacteria bacterium]|nr:histidinol dehydrogenase [Actinomycetota bacterium]
MLAIFDARDIFKGLESRLPRPAPLNDSPTLEVRRIIDAVIEKGDQALRELTYRFDGVALQELRVSPSELEEGSLRAGRDLVDALVAARDRIEAFHRHQLLEAGPYSSGGVVVEELIRPVMRAGLYAPGGRARYPSTVLMTAVPARVAGVKEIALCVPPGASGEIDDATLAAAVVAGVDEVYRIGGAQAIAAMAFGTESIQAVEVVAGPGNRYVAEAQRQVAGVVGVAAGFAGPSEVVVVADEEADPLLAAIDVVVQAEHGPDGLAWLVSWSEKVVKAVVEEVGRLAASSVRRAEIRSTLSVNGHAVLVRDAIQAMEVANAVAPEHLELHVADPRSLLGLVQNAGAVFLGSLAPASLGDYAAGPSHVLPTNRSARFAGALRVDDFIKRIHVISVDAAGFETLAWVVEALADVEGLVAHSDSVRLRFNRSKEMTRG